MHNEFFKMFRRLLYFFYGTSLGSRLIFGIPILVFFVFMIFMIGRGESGYCRLADNMDSHLPLIVAQCNQSDTIFDIFSINPIKAIMCGNGYCEVPKVIILLIYIFGLVNGWAVNCFCVRCIAYLGMYLLLSKHLIKGKKSQPLVVIVSFCFAILPNSEILGIGIVGYPLLLYSLINLYQKRGQWSDWIILSFSPFYMVLPLGLLFFIICLLQWWITDMIIYRRFHVMLSVGISVLLLSTAFNNMTMISRSLDKNYVSHRTEWSEYSRTSFEISKTLSQWKTLILSTSPSYNGNGELLGGQPIRYFWLSVMLSILIMLKNEKINRKFILFFLIFMWLNLMQAFDWRGCFYYFTGHFAPMIQIRFYYLFPFCYFIVFALCLESVRRFFSFRISFILIAFFVAIFCYWILLTYNNSLYCGYYWAEFKSNYITHRSLPDKCRNNNIKFLLRTDLYEAIKDYIGKPQNTYRIGTITTKCLHPMPAVVSGFYTIDGYVNDYSLEYKKNFRKIIDIELEKSVIEEHLWSWKKYYDTWGSRCYLFTAITPLTGSVSKYVNLEFDTMTLVSLNCQFLISEFPIEDCEKTGLIFEKDFHNSTLNYALYLYRVSPE
jgi:hypothetical protein